MPSTLPSSLRPLLLVPVIALGLAACDDATATPTDPVAEPPAAPSEAPIEEPTDDAASEEPADHVPAEPVDTAPIVASWDPTAPPVGLGGGLALADCDGDAPLLCVFDGGAEIGHLEALHYPAPEQLAGSSGDELDSALRELAATQARDMAADRAAGCGADNEVMPDAPSTTTVDGQQGLRYGFTTVVDGEAVERVVTWATVRDDQLHLVVAAAVAPGTCMDDGMRWFAPAVLGDLVPLLDRVVAGTALPV